MVNKCVAVSCNSGYASSSSSSTTSGFKVTFHRFPKDTILRRKWLSRLSRENFTPSSHSRLCSRHFVDSDFMTCRNDSNRSRSSAKSATPKRRLLKSDAVPSVFTNLPKYLSYDTHRREDPPTAEVRRAAILRDNEEKIHSFLLDDVVSSLSDIFIKLQSSSNLPTGFLYTRLPDCVLIYTIDSSDGLHPKIIGSITISNELGVSLVCRDAAVKKNIFSHISSGKINLFSQIVNLMALLKSLISTDECDVESFIDSALKSLQGYIDGSDPDTDKHRSVAFFLEQLQLLDLPKNRRRYSPALLLFAFSIYSSGPASYRALLSQNVLTLPSVGLLNKLTRSVRSDPGICDEQYLVKRFSRLSELQHHIMIIIDEVYVTTRPEFSSGNIIGKKDSNTVLTFMIKSVAGKYRDVVGLFPMSNLTASIQHDIFLSVLRMVTDIGFNVVSISVDNHTVNRAFYRLLCAGDLLPEIPHPFNNEKSIFLVFDPTHCVKNVFNNFERKKVFKVPASEPIIDQPCIASYSDIEKLCERERLLPLRIAHKITPSILHPSSIQRSSMKYFISVFHESTRDALDFYSNEKMNKSFSSTSKFISIILKLWDVLNVRSTTIGKHKRKTSKDPVLSSSDWKLCYLIEFASFLTRWEDSNAVAGLSKETFTALRHSCISISLLSKYLIEHLNFKYVLLGNIQSDALESRFGWYRQLSGANYFLSLNQVLQNEKRIKAISLVKYSHFTFDDIKDLDIESSMKTENVEHESDLMLSKLNQEPDAYIDSSSKSILYYVCGYVAKSVGSRCTDCNHVLSCDSALVPPQFDVIDENTTRLLDAINRGGLRRPSHFLYCICLKSWCIFTEMKNNATLFTAFLDLKNQRSVFSEICKKSVFSDDSIRDIVSENISCSKGHDVLTRSFICFFNCVAKNLAKDLAEAFIKEKNERKIKKLTAK